MPADRPTMSRVKLTVGSVLVTGVLLVTLLGSLLTSDPYSQDLESVLQQPSSQHLLGTDHLGRDVLSRLVTGARKSLSTSLVIVAGSLGVGLILGMVAGWYGGGLDMVLMRLVDVTLAFPGILLAVLLGGLFGGGVWMLALALILTGWPEVFRLARNLSRTVTGREYVEAAVLSGFSDRFLLWRYVLPEIVPVLTVFATLNMGRTILAVSSLGFIGIGLTPPEPGWGQMIAEGLSYMRLSPYLVIVPSGAVFCSVLGFYLTGSSLSHRYARREQF
jgi:ABC-type dipeptide/oligopeptide/nickel transport system permease subunit